MAPYEEISGTGLAASGSPSTTSLGGGSGGDRPDYLLGEDGLSGELWRRFCAARDARKSGSVEAGMIEDRRRRDGEYEPTVLAQLAAQGGSKAFDNVTDVKCSGAEAMLVDLFCYSGGKAWGLEPTPEPEMEEGATRAALERAMEWAAAQGVDPGAAENEAALLEVAMAIKERLKGEIEREAKRRAGKMEKLIEDQLKEGGFEEALNDFIVDFVTLPVAALMGPLPTMKLVQRGGRWEEKLVLAVERVNPTDVYPAANSLKPEDGDFFVRKVVSDDFAYGLSSCPGVDKKQLAKALALGSSERENVDDANESYATRGGSVSGNKPDKEHVLVYWWHRLTAKEMAEWKGDEFEEVEGAGAAPKVAYWGLMLNGVVIKAIENLDKSGKPCVYVASFRRRVGSFWGRGLSELCKESQEAANVVKRATMNNIHMSSMASYQADKAALVQPDSMAKQFPGQVILTRQMPGDNRDPVKALLTPNYTATLLEARRDLVTALDEKTGIYPQSYGNPQQVGPAETMGGYQMLRQDQSKTLKRALKNMSDAVAGLIRGYWQWNMAFAEDEDVKGDVEIVARGAVQLYMTGDEIERTLGTTRMIESSQMAQRFVRPEGIVNLYKKAVRMNRIEPDEVFMSDKEIAEMVAADRARQEAEAQMAAQGGGQPQEIPEPESARIKAQADMMKAEAAQQKVQLEAKRVAIQQADVIGRLRQAQENIRRSRLGQQQPMAGAVQGGK